MEFSEEFHAIEHYGDDGWNLTTINENIEQIILIEYYSSIVADDEGDS